VSGFRLLIAGSLVAAIAAGAWRLLARRESAPCPAWLSWLLENPYMNWLAGAEALIERADVAPGMVVLDAGCGPGRLTVPLARKVGPNGRVVAVDVQPEMLRRAQAKVEAAGLGNVAFVEARLGEQQLPRERFDRAFLVTVLGEIPNRQAALADIYQSLKPGGLLSVTEVLPDPHFQTRKSVRRLAAQAGFRPGTMWRNPLAYTWHLARQAVARPEEAGLASGELHAGHAVGPITNGMDELVARARLLRSFDKAIDRLEPQLVARYGREETRRLIHESRQAYETLIPKIPDIGNPVLFQLFLLPATRQLALYRTLLDHGSTVEEAGQAVLEMGEASVRAIPAVVRRLVGYVWFTPWFLNLLRRRALESQQRTYPDGYRFHFVQGDGLVFDYGIDYTECASLKFLDAQGARSMAPYVCAVDRAASELLGWGLRREMTLAEGCPRCDFRFKKGGATFVPLPASNGESMP